MSNAMIGLLSIGAMLILIQLGMHISVALMAISFVGVWLIRGDFNIAGDMLSLAPWKASPPIHSASSRCLS